MPTISVFTCSHDPKYLDECYDSLAAQSFTDWEWVIVLNRGAEWVGWPRDPRIKYHEFGVTAGVGALKGIAVGLCTGKLLVEFDHDDLFRGSGVLQALDRATDIWPDASLIYSDCAQINEDGTPNYDRFDLRHGWDYWKVPNTEFLGVRALAPTPHNVSNIWYAPNHVRAFPRWAYDKAGGYDPELEVCDDLDLMCRLYQVGPFVHLPDVLYLQRVHAGNTQKDRNALIQTETLRLYDQYIQPNALAWANREGLLALDLGGAHNPPAGYLTVDQHGGDYTGDVFDVLGNMADSSAGVIRASDFLEHVREPVELMNELHRVLAPNGLLLTCTPSTDGRGAFQDPTHVSFWNANSFWYYTRAEQAKYVPEITGRWQASRIVDFFPSPWHEENLIPYVQANLIPLKGTGFRDGGIVGW